MWQPSYQQSVNCLLMQFTRSIKPTAVLENPKLVPHVLNIYCMDHSYHVNNSQSHEGIQTVKTLILMQPYVLFHCHQVEHFLLEWNIDNNA